MECPNRPSMVDELLNSKDGYIPMKALQKLIDHKDEQCPICNRPMVIVDLPEFEDE